MSDVDEVMKTFTQMVCVVWLHWQ